MTSRIYGRQPRRRDLLGLPIDSGSGTTRSGTTVWIPACFSCVVCGECGKERRDRYRFSAALEVAQFAMGDGRY